MNSSWIEKLNGANFVHGIKRFGTDLKKWGFLLLLVGLVAFPGCDSDEIDDESYYTFSGETIGQYLRNRPEKFSEFSALLDTTDVIGLLNAYGQYTCFAPTNEAMTGFYEARGKNSLSDFPMDSLKKIAYDHIIKDAEVTADVFAEGSLPNSNMNGRSIILNESTGEEGLFFMVYGSALISETNIETHNGVMHTVESVLQPTDKNLVEAIGEESKFSLFYEALIATGLNEKLMKVEDEDFTPDPDLIRENDGQMNGTWLMRTPRVKRYGFTALVVSDATFSDAGIQSLEDMKNYAAEVYDNVYPEAAEVEDITDPENSLNRFIAYHLIPKKIEKYYFIEAWDNTGTDAGGTTHSVKAYNNQLVDLAEYIETMAPLSLMEVTTVRENNELNVFNRYEPGEGVRLTDDFDNEALNGVFHEVDGILTFSEDVKTMLTSKRLRMDAASFLPELMNNGIRVGTKYPSSRDTLAEEWYFPHGFFERLDVNESTNVMYYNADDRFMDYQGDEIFLGDSHDRNNKILYDITIETPPIPAGTYEIRFGYQPTGNRGAAQMYWDGKPAGIPLDLRLLASNPKVGWQEPGMDPDATEGFENDRMMRNRGYMKGPASFRVVRDANNGGWYSGPNARESENALRRILGIFTFEEDGHHTFSVRASRGGEFMFDYLEFVPVEVIEREDIF